jgi:hypothetical protein
MTIKLNSFILPDSVIQKMKKNVEYSRFENIEFGFNLCSDNQKGQKLLHDEKPCLGDQCSVDIPKGCDKGEHVGLFHTHATASSKPSIRDILNAYKLSINCIGSVEEDSIKCYMRKDKIYKTEERDNIVAAMARYESPLLSVNIPPEDIKEYYKKWEKVREELTEHYLDTIDGI